MAKTFSFDKKQRFIFLLALVSICLSGAFWQFTRPKLLLDDAKKIVTVPEWRNEGIETAPAHRYRWLSKEEILIQIGTSPQTNVQYAMKLNGEKRIVDRDVGASILSSPDINSRFITLDGNHFGQTRTQGIGKTCVVISDTRSATERHISLPVSSEYSMWDCQWSPDDRSIYAVCLSEATLYKLTFPSAKVEELKLHSLPEDAFKTGSYQLCGMTEEGNLLVSLTPLIDHLFLSYTDGRKYDSILEFVELGIGSNAKYSKRFQVSISHEDYLKRTFDSQKVCVSPDCKRIMYCLYAERDNSFLNWVGSKFPQLAFTPGHGLELEIWAGNLRGGSMRLLGKLPIPRYMEAFPNQIQPQRTLDSKSVSFHYGDSIYSVPAN